MTKENLSKLFSFKTLYLALLTFVILHLILLAFGLSFTPVLWNSWFFILCLTFFIHPWIVFFKRFSMVPPNFSIIQCTSGTLSLVFGILCFVNHLGSSNAHQYRLSYTR